MNWLTQVFHVAKNDVRRFWWLLGLNLLLLAAAAGSAQQWFSGTDQALGGMAGVGPSNVSVFAILLSLLSTLVLIQADSPVKSDAFWPTRPIRGSAMAGAKGLVIGGFFVAAPVACLVAVLLGNGVSAEATRQMAMDSFMLYAAFMGVAAVLGAITVDLKEGLAVAAVGGTVMVVGGRMIAAASTVFSTALSGDFVDLRYVWAAGGVALVTMAYRNRSRSRTVLGAGLLCLVSLGAKGVVATPITDFHEDAISLSAEEGGGALQAKVVSVSVRPERRTKNQSWLSVELSLTDVKPGHRYLLDNLAMDLTLSSGEVLKGALSSPALLGEPFGLPAGYKTIASGQRMSSQQTNSAAQTSVVTLGPLSWDEMKRFLSQGGDVVLTGDVRVYREFVWASFPLQVGHGFGEAGRGVRVLEAGLRNGRAYTKLEERWITGQLGRRFEYFRYALVNEDNSVGIDLGVGGSWGTASVPLLTVNVGRTTKTAEYVSDSMNDSGQEWLKGPGLIVLDVALRGTRPVNATIRDIDTQELFRDGSR